MYMNMLVDISLIMVEIVALARSMLVDVDVLVVVTSLKFASVHVNVLMNISLVMVLMLPPMLVEIEILVIVTSVRITIMDMNMFVDISRLIRVVAVMMTFVSIGKNVNTVFVDV